MPDLPFRYDRHVFLPRLDLWLDSRQPRDFAFVSHAHSDHTGRHRRVLLSERTWTLFQHRLYPGRPAGAAGRRGSQPVSLPFHTPWTLGGQEVELLPAGHVLGSAQLLVRQDDGTRLVYTGDLKLTARPTAEPAATPRCDVLVIESTFGRPQYRFPPPSEVRAQLYAEVERGLAEGRVPVAFAYSLGKAQEATNLLAAGGYRVLVHPAVAAINRLYEAHGVALGPWQPLPAADLAGAVLVLPPRRQRGDPIPFLPAGVRARTIMLTGWALDRAARYRYGVDAAIPLSDHADWTELLAYVERAQPRRVFTVHGFPEFAAHLRAGGIEATHLPDHQPTLFDGL